MPTSAVAGLPLLVPLMAAAVVVGVFGSLLAAVVWLFSRGGRSCVQRVVQPVYDRIGRENPEVTLLKTETNQGVEGVLAVLSWTALG